MKILGIVAALALLVGGLTVGAFHYEVGGLNWDKITGSETAMTVEGTETTETVAAELVSIIFFTEAERRQLVQFRLDYMLAKDPFDRDAIAEAALLTFKEYNDITLAPELREWLTKIKNRGPVEATMPVDVPEDSSF